MTVQVILSPRPPPASWVRLNRFAPRPSQFVATATLRRALPAQIQDLGLLNIITELDLLSCLQ
jgi:hypothetical protein